MRVDKAHASSIGKVVLDLSERAAFLLFLYLKPFEKKNLDKYAICSIIRLTKG